MGLLTAAAITFTTSKILTQYDIVVLLTEVSPHVMYHDKREHCHFRASDGSEKQVNVRNWIHAKNMPAKVYAWRE